MECKHVKKIQCLTDRALGDLSFPEDRAIGINVNKSSNHKKQAKYDSLDQQYITLRNYESGTILQCPIRDIRMVMDFW